MLKNLLKNLSQNETKKEHLEDNLPQKCGLKVQTLEIQIALPKNLKTIRLSKVKRSQRKDKK